MREYLRHGPYKVSLLDRDSVGAMEIEEGTTILPGEGVGIIVAKGCLWVGACCADE